MPVKVILVHGFIGDMKTTWKGFPELLNAEPDISCDVAKYGYSSFYWPFIGKDASIHNLAEGLLTEIESRCNLEEDEIILVGHSLGGLVIRKMLLNLHLKKIKHNIHKVFFFAVPHDGSGLGNIPSLIAIRNNKLKALCKDSSYLEEMNDLWNYAHLNDQFDILNVIGGKDAVVNSNSVKSIFRDHPVKTNIDAGHLNIVKPKNSDDLSFILLRDFIKKKNSITNNKPSNARSFEDWKKYEKLSNIVGFVCDEKRNKQFDSLKEILARDRASLRVTGLSGLGKSRLVAEAIQASKNIDVKDVLVFNAASSEAGIEDSFRKAVDRNQVGVLVVENCSSRLHEALTKELFKIETQLILITLDFDSGEFCNTELIDLSPLKDETIQEILTPAFSEEIEDLDRIAKFAQGSPMMAVLLAKERIEGSENFGRLNIPQIAGRLLWGNSEKCEVDEKTLMACALFDVFGVEDSGKDELAFLAKNIADIDSKDFYSVVKKYQDKKLIDRRGDFARLVPKPLALSLASVWWHHTSHDTEIKLVESLPDSLLDSFCQQVVYLDSLDDVKEFSNKLCENCGPFGKAEVLLTDRGSKLFRAFVNVNPDATSQALYNVLTDLKREELLEINSSVRRNLIWALEKLCFHDSVFEQSAWSLFLLATAENESYGNNSTGIFTQLFQIRLSGTEAIPEKRFNILQRIIDLNNVDSDLVLVKALESGVSLHGNSRMVGAEYQGTKSPLKEWIPKKAEDYYDYWQKCFDLLLLLIERSEVVREEAKKVIGQSIRGFVQQGRFEMLDTAITDIVKNYGVYWPSALESLKNTIKFNGDKLSEDKHQKLYEWLDILSPSSASLEEKLRIIVLDPPREYSKKEGKYVDIAAENAKKFATELSEDPSVLVEYIPLLLSGEQKQTFIFGQELAVGSELIVSFIDQVTAFAIMLEDSNPRFLFGLLSGLYSKDSKTWFEIVDGFSNKEELIKFYPEVISTGKMEEIHLNTLLELIKSNKLVTSACVRLSYGSVTEHLPAEIICEFCTQLSEVGVESEWNSLNIIFMYCFGDSDKFMKCKYTIESLVTKVSLSRAQKGGYQDIYNWKELTKKLLDTEDINFAKSICIQIISATDNALEHDDIWSSIKPVLSKIMNAYGRELWDLFSEAIISSEGMKRYWLKEILEKDDSFSNQQKSIFSILPNEIVMKWCEKYSEIAPAFVAECIDVLESDGDEIQITKIALQLIEKYSDDVNVDNALFFGLTPSGWSGSLVPHLEDSKNALNNLTKNSNANVRMWAKEKLTYIDQKIAIESKRDSEYVLGVF